VHSAAPEKLFASILVASLVGIGFVGIVVLAERVLIPPSRRLEDVSEAAESRGRGLKEVVA